MEINGCKKRWIGWKMKGIFIVALYGKVGAALAYLVRSDGSGRGRKSRSG